MAYTQVTVTGYNSSPPSDDGEATSANQIAWVSIKTKLFDVLKTAFESIDDNVLSAVATADSTLATLQSGVSSAQSSVANITTTLNAASGTVLLFRQTAAPTGWTKGTTYDNYALRLVTGTASNGGSTAFTSIFAARTIATANLPVHSHNFSDASSTASFTCPEGNSFVYDVNETTDGGFGGGTKSLVTDVNETSTAITGTWTMSVASSGSGSGGTWDFAVQYVDLIYATKT
jgi:hypothetical protein